MSANDDRTTYSIQGIDRETGESVSYPTSADEVEQMMIATEGLPDPENVIDDE
jgi:hypothetical protein